MSDFDAKARIREVIRRQREGTGDVTAIMVSGVGAVGQMISICRELLYDAEKYHEAMQWLMAFTSDDDGYSNAQRKRVWERAIEIRAQTPHDIGMKKAIIQACQEIGMDR